MFFFKALFVRLHGLMAPCVSLWAVWHLALGQWLWLAPLLAWAPVWGVNQWRVHQGNIAFLDDRERLLLMPALVGVGIVLVSGERDYLLWWTLAGLFALLLNTVVMSKLTRGVREAKGESLHLASMTFQTAEGESVSASLARVLLFVHSGWNPYSLMQLRDLEQFLRANPSLSPESIALVFAEQIPSNCQPLMRLQSMGVRVWCDGGENSAQLGLWLRGASVMRSGTGNALRPAMAVLRPESEAPALWLVANTDRLPPSASEYQARLLQLLGA
ncbi:MAG: hypothetical protein ACRBBW_00775 [Cellvibrionaceae bacterium]